MRRLIEGSLDFWGEHWADLSVMAQYAAWEQLAEARGSRIDTQYRMTRNLLSEVIYAAGGVEREFGLLAAALADVQQFADESAESGSPRPSLEEWRPSVWHVTTPSMREASYAFANLLIWARATMERTA